MPLGKAWRAINASSTPLRPLPLGQSLWTRPTACAPSSPTRRSSRLCRRSNSLCAAPPSPGWSLTPRLACLEFAAARSQDPDALPLLLAARAECSDPSRLAAHAAGQPALPEEPLWPRRRAQNNNGNNKRGWKTGLQGGLMAHGARQQPASAGGSHRRAGEGGVAERSTKKHVPPARHAQLWPEDDRLGGEARKKKRNAPNLNERR